MLRASGGRARSSRCLSTLRSGLFIYSLLSASWLVFFFPGGFLRQRLTPAFIIRRQIKAFDGKKNHGVSIQSVTIQWHFSYRNPTFWGRTSPVSGYSWVMLQLVHDASLLRRECTAYTRDIHIPLSGLC